MKRMSVFLVVGLCLLLFTGCANNPVSPVTTYKFTIDGVVVKDMNYSEDIAYFVVQRDSIPFDGAVITVESETLSSYGSGEYYFALPFTVFHPRDTLAIVISCASDSVTFNKKIVMPDTFRITNILPSRLDPGGDSRVIYWTASQYASGYFVVAFHSPAVGHNAVVSYNSTTETIDRSAFRTSQDGLITGTYPVYVVSYRESFLSYIGMTFAIPDSLPTGNIDGANGTIGAGVIAPKDSIVVTTL